MLKYIFLNSKDSLATTIAINTALTAGILLGCNAAGGLMARDCPPSSAFTNDPTDQLFARFCVANNELSVASPTRTAANLKVYWYLTKKKLGLEPQ